MDAIGRSVNPYASPAVYAESSPEQTEGDFGGINRTTYIILSMLIPVLFAVIIKVVAPFFGEMARLMALGIVIVQVAVHCYLVALRHVNLGYSPYWCVGILVPILNVFVAVRCLIFPAGYAKHRRLDSYAIVMICFVLVVPFLFVFALSYR